MQRASLCCAALFVAALAAPSVRADINSSAASFLQGKLGKRVGGGECSHLACEALRVAGGEFTKTYLGADKPNAGDYVWGTLVKTISYKNGKATDSAPSAKVKKGDIIQYRNAKFVYPTYWTQATQHTTVVAAVTSNGTRPTAVYEQNFNNDRTCKRRSIDTTKLAAGWLRIYRPVPRGSKGGSSYLRFTVVNNRPTSQKIKINSNTFTMGSANTINSYYTFYATPGSKLNTGNTTYTVQNARGYEMYRTSAGANASRILSP